MDDVTISGDCIIRAVRAYSLGRDNRWTEPATHLIHSYEANLASANVAAPLDVAPKRKQLAPAAHRRHKNRARKSQNLIDTEAIKSDDATSIVIPSNQREPRSVSPSSHICASLIDTKAIRK